MTRVVVMGWLTLISTPLLAIAGILTPIGLGEAIFLSSSTTAMFVYAKDPSAFGGMADSREQYSSSRTCNFGKSPCPGVTENDTVSILADLSGGEKGPLTYYQNYISQDFTDCFSSGSQGSLIASPFDIQFRQFEVSSNELNLTAEKNTIGYSTGLSIFCFLMRSFVEKAWLLMPSTEVLGSEIILSRYYLTMFMERLGPKTFFGLSRTQFVLIPTGLSRLGLSWLRSRWVGIFRCQHMAPT